MFLTLGLFIKLLRTIFFGLVFSSPCLALNLDQVYGSSDSKYIQIYFEKFYSWLVTVHPDLKKCLREEEQKQIKDIIGRSTSWGARIHEGVIDYTLQMSYSQNASRLFKTLHLNDGSMDVRWTVDEKGGCRVEKFARVAPKAIVNKNRVKGPFQGVALFQYGDQIYMEAFSLSYLHPQNRYWAQQHLKEFNQLCLRVRWNSESDYEVFFP